MKTNHTQGEWMYSSGGKNMRSYSQSHAVARMEGNRCTLVAGCFYDIPGGEEEAEANAKLIAAAPDLLKELTHLVRLMEPLEQEGGLNIPGLATLNGARRAIVKAINGR